MMQNSIYQIGGSLSNDAPTYIVREADSELYQALKAAEFCYILNSRQMGKSSILVRTRHILQQEEFKCTTIDMTRIGSENITLSQWYKGVVSELWRGLNLVGKVNLKSWWIEEKEVSVIQSLSNFIEDIILASFPQEKIIIFIDEIDSILSLNFSVDDFFALIRFCYNQRAINPEYNRLTFAIFGVATPSDLINDKKRTPFNIGKAIELQGFKPEETEPLAQGLAPYIENPQKVVREILRWTGGQPFLTQKICDLVLSVSQERVRKKLTIPPGQEGFWVESIVRTHIIEKWESQDEPEHLRTIRDRLNYNQQRKGRLLGIYQQILQGEKVTANDSREHTELILSGLIVKYQGDLQVKNKIYAQVFNLNWVASELGELRPYSQTFDAWIASEKTDESRLLRGQALKDAQIWSQGKSLSDLDYQFLAASVEWDRKEVQLFLEAERAKAIKAESKAIEAQLLEQKQRLLQEQKNAKLQRLFLGIISIAFLIASGLGLFAYQQYKEAKISEIKALASSSQGLFSSNRQLDAMIEALKAKRKLEGLGGVDPEIKENVDQALKQTVYNNNEFNRLIGHQNSILGVAISPNDQLIATASMDKTVKIWQRDGKLLQPLNHPTSVTRVAFGPDSQQIVSGTSDGWVKLWRIDGSLVKTFQAHKTPVWGVAFSSDGKRIASSSADKTIKLWDLNAKLLQTFQGHQLPVWNVAFSPDSQIVASASLDNTVKLWSVDGKLLKTLEGHQHPVWDVAFCSQGNLLVSGSGDRTAKIWKTDGTLVKTLESNDAIMGVDCQGEYIATGGKDNQVKVWKIDGTFIRDLKQHYAAIRDIAMSSDGLMIASASFDRTVKLWQRHQYLLKPIYGHKDTIWDIATSPDGKLFATVSEDNTLKLWHSDGSLWQTIEQPQSSFRSVKFTPDSRLMVTGNNNYTVQIWDLGDRDRSPVKLLRTFKGHQATVFSIAIAPDGKTIATGGDDRTIKIWNLDGKLLHNIQAHKERIGKLTFNPNGQLLASASQDGTVKLWQADGTFVKTLIEQNVACWGVAFSPQGNLITSVCQDSILKLWNIDGTLLKTIDTKSESLTRVDFSPDGQIIATGSLNNQVKLWNLEGKLLKSLPGHQGAVMTLVFTANGKFLISGGDDHTVIMWDINKILQINELTYACDWVRDYLRTNAEVEERDRALCDGINR
jgi:WD40 repeat protein